MRKKTTKKNSSSKRGNKNVDSWGLRMVKNVGGALPLVGLLVGGAALAVLGHNRHGLIIKRVV